MAEGEGEVVEGVGLREEGAIPVAREGDEDHAEVREHGDKGDAGEKGGAGPSGGAGQGARSA